MDQPLVTRPAAVRAQFLPFAPPCLGDEEIAEVVAALRSDWITTGPRVEEFERRFAARVGAADAVALNSCTAGLETALTLCGVGPGDVVVTTPLTFVGTVNAIVHTGATPRFADVHTDTLCLDAERAREAVRAARARGERVRAVLPVHYAGHAADLDAFDALAADEDLVLVEDAAHALPTRLGAHTVGGARGRALASFSFYANKNITTGEGGMLTGPPEVLARARAFRNHGLSRDPWRRGGPHASWRYDAPAPGHKFNMTDIAAALGLRQLDRLDAFHARRRAIAAHYDAAFAGHPALEPPTTRAACDPARHLYPLRLRLERLAIDRDRFVEELHARNIGTSVHFIPVHHLAWVRERLDVDASLLPVTEREFPRLVSLPIHPRLDDGDVADVVAAVLDVAERGAA